jgi:hypothetical protein
MKQTQLIPFVEIKGIGAASGLVYREQSLFIISDNSTFLYHYNLSEKQLHKIKLLDSSQENLTKKEKADFESVTLYNDELYIHGSGSTNQRQLRVKYNLATQETKEKDLTKLYHRLRKSIGLAEDDLNIEGCIMKDDYYYFFQRGNGTQAQNGIFRYTRKTKEVRFHSIVLPKLKGVEATFTDAILVDDTVYFLAACEDTTSTYNDGEVYGSFLGGLDLDNYAVLFASQITDAHKFEGLTLLMNENESLTFLLCEDNDTEEDCSIIYQLQLTNKLSNM